MAWILDHSEHEHERKWDSQKVYIRENKFISGLIQNGESNSSSGSWPVVEGPGVEGDESASFFPLAVGRSVGEAVHWSTCPALGLNTHLLNSVMETGEEIGRGAYGVV